MKTIYCLLISSFFSCSLVAQTFTEQTGGNNPFNGVNVGANSTPSFTDIDNDGDFDAFIGESLGTIKYYKNTGSNTVPTFTEQTGGNNPLNSIVYDFVIASFIDIDNDNDFDCFIGELFGTIKYYKNTGSNTAPTFTEQTGGNNPFNGVDVGFNATPTFIDIDNDNDFDVFIGVDDGTIKYYKNTGSNTAPTFTEQTGTSNPFNNIDVGFLSTPTFIDIDNDNDFDCFIGEGSGTIKYYKNTGSNTVPTFTEQTGTSNPFNGVSIGGALVPTFTDIDNDSDFDAFIGNDDGVIKYYKNSTALPVELTYFKGQSTSEGYLLTWQTVTEENNEGFEIQHSVNGREWNNIGFVLGNGTTQEVHPDSYRDYQFIDQNPKSGVNYYRLKQMDFDGQFEYSNIVNIEYQTGNNELRIFPNPVKDELNIITNEPTHILIINTTGQVLKEQTIQNKETINVSDLPSGIYFLKVGQVTKKFILQR